MNTNVSRKAYGGYFFDLDGTLIDTAPDLNQAQNAALTAFGYEPAREEQTRYWVGKGARFLLAQSLADQGATEEHIDAMFDHFLEYYAQHIAERSAPYPGVVDALHTLRDAGARLAVVTNKKESLSHLLMQTLELDSLFDTLVGGDTAAQPKPDAAPARLTCERLDLRASDVLFVGDSSTDVGCARAFGCDIACVSYGYSQGTPADELGADWVIDSFTELVTAR